MGVCEMVTVTLVVLCYGDRDSVVTVTVFETVIMTVTVSGQRVCVMVKYAVTAMTVTV